MTGVTQYVFIVSVCVGSVLTCSCVSDDDDRKQWCTSGFVAGVRVQDEGTAVSNGKNIQIQLVKMFRHKKVNEIVSDFIQTSFNGSSCSWTPKKDAYYVLTGALREDSTTGKHYMYTYLCNKAEEVADRDAILNYQQFICPTHTCEDNDDCDENAVCSDMSCTCIGKYVMERDGKCKTALGEVCQLDSEEKGVKAIGDPLIMIGPIAAPSTDPPNCISDARCTFNGTDNVCTCNTGFTATDDGSCNAGNTMVQSLVTVLALVWIVLVLRQMPLR